MLRVQTKSLPIQSESWKTFHHSRKGGKEGGREGIKHCVQDITEWYFMQKARSSYQHVYEVFCSQHQVNCWSGLWLDENYDRATLKSSTFWENTEELYILGEHWRIHILGEHRRVLHPGRTLKKSHSGRTQKSSTSWENTEDFYNPQLGYYLWLSLCCVQYCL